MTLPHGAHRLVVCVALIGLASASTVWATQTDVFLGRWIADQPDRGIVVTLTVGSASTLVMPGTGPSGRTEPLTLKVRNLKTVQRTATFAVDLPLDEGCVEFEFRVDDAAERGFLRALRIDGEPVDDDVPTWALRKAAEAALPMLFQWNTTSIAGSVVSQGERRLGILTLATPDTRGEILRVVVPIGELTTRLTRTFSRAMNQRAERRAREMVERDLRNFLAQQAAK